ncbi:MAG: adenosylcobinamide-GDP ribazoletransferase [Propionibacteriaceae bacterium]|jgi:adenosylcobinamide-GDP ribazoletransferase|nr:adenosylcobinamide-GDP ribazoletransferase [Propionibacteriaceae bacterium]
MSEAGETGADAPRRPDRPGAIRPFLTAVMFYTRLPVPRWVGYSDELMTRSTRYFPAIGWLVGGLTAAVLWAAWHVFPTTIAAVLALAAGVLVTGGFHEDGFADVCDGFGGGTTRERTLAIMKDSRVGAFAVLGLILLFGLKVAALGALAGYGWSGLAAIVYAHVLSRWAVVTLIATGTYARDDLTSKVRPVARSISGGGLIVATLWLLPAVVWVWWQPFWLLAIPLAFLVRLAFGRWCARRLGGYTGDCLGALQQVLEVVTYLTCLGLAGAGL